MNDRSADFLKGSGQSNQPHLRWGFVDPVCMRSTCQRIGYADAPPRLSQCLHKGRYHENRLFVGRNESAPPILEGGCQSNQPHLRWGFVDPVCMRSTCQRIGYADAPPRLSQCLHKGRYHENRLFVGGNESAPPILEGGGQSNQPHLRWGFVFDSGIRTSSSLHKNKAPCYAGG